MARNPISSLTAKAVAATLRWALTNDSVRRPAAPTLALDPSKPEARDRELLRDLRREARERRGAEAALRASQAELKEMTARAEQEARERERLESEKIRLEEQLRQAQKMEALGRLAGGIAHDFNNVLGVVAGCGEILLRQLEPASPHRRRVEQLLHATQRAAALTRRLLTFSRKQAEEPKALDLGAVARDMAEMLQQMTGEDVRISLEAPEGLGVVRADPGHIEQVLMNLVANAREAMPTGGSLRISLRNVDGGTDPRAAACTATGRCVRLEVADTGGGMDEETLAHVFEPFFTTKQQGTGLGLATVQQIVARNNGQIHVESRPGHGTAFQIYFPRVDEAVARPLPEAPSPAGGRETILLVEDDEALRELVAEALVDAGYAVLSAPGGLEALQQVQQYSGPIHMTLVDVVMPGMNGRELAQRLNYFRPGLRVLYMSGYTDDVITARGLLEPGTLLLHKPFGNAALLQHVRSALAATRIGSRTEASLAVHSRVM